MFRYAIIAGVLISTMVAPWPSVAMTDSGPRQLVDTECPRPLLATPAALATPDTAVVPISGPLADVEEIEEGEMPVGPDAGLPLVATLLTLEQHYAACLNAGDYAAIGSLFDAPLRERFLDELSRGGIDVAGTPVAPPEDRQIDTLALCCVRTYPGGYAAALLDWEIDGSIETSAREYRDTGAGWLISGEVPTYGQQGVGCGHIVSLVTDATHRIPGGLSINLRSEPSRDASIVRALPPGTLLSYLDVDAPNDDPLDGSRWMQFTTPDGDTGWIRESDVEDATP